MDHTNTIYAEVQPKSENDYVMDVQKNECYQTPTVTPTFKQPYRPVKELSSSKKTVVVLGLIFATLVLVLGGVASATAYALVEIANLKVAISLDEAASLQQTSKLVLQTAQELNSRIQQLQDSYNSTVQRVNINENVAEINATIYQQVIQEISAASTRLTASISALQQKSAQNDSTLVTRITQVETSCNNQYHALDSRTTASISTLRQQSAQNDTALDVRLISHISSSNTAHQQLNYSIVLLNSIMGKYSTYPAPSCDDLSPSFPAGYYYILSSTGSAVYQYCYSRTTRCGQTGRWRSVANVDITRLYSSCPAELILHRNFSKTFCIRHSNSPGCSSVQLPTTTAYRSVCGFVKAYQFGQPEAFNGQSSIDSYYVDGVSITHGSPRQHIWTFAATWDEDSGRSGCPCTGGSSTRPSFVGNDYFCDTGTPSGSGPVFYGYDPLWDGAGCDGPSNTCCIFNTPPWFYKELSQYTHDTIELRICSNQDQNNEDTFLEAFTIYVK